MNSADVSKLVASEIASAGDDWFEDPRNNPHRLDMAHCLVPPTRVTCTNVLPGEREERFDVWLVLAELPGNDDGYQIVFEEEANKFGLACGTRESPVLVGLYGSFLETVQSM
jgi:hypothetical protein